jgi:hypothetical protein
VLRPDEERSVGREKLTLLLINVIGGIAVIGSYIFGLRGPSGTDALWGGVPEAIRPVYAVSMVLAAIGYFAFLNLLLLRVDSTKVTVAGRFKYSVFYPIFALILFPSALWMPLTDLYVDDPSAGAWVGIRIVLFVVALASIALAWALFTIRPGNQGKAYWAAVVGSCYFAFHTLVLDAILWATLFRG